MKNDVKDSQLSTLAATYVTGGSVIVKEAEDVFIPALGETLAPGVVVSILIVGILFAAPLAAILPLLLGGLSIAIAYAVIYLGVVVGSNGKITFLTPTLTTLLMLGLAVDYSVLQLRRMKEERTNGRTKEESVATSVRWAGQAVITAGLTVIVAYVILAVANVPIFNDVGVSIAIGVSVLLLASVTLLPSLELLFGDRLFWPRLKPNGGQTRPGLLAKISDATLKHKLYVAIIITLLAGGAVRSHRQHSHERGRSEAHPQLPEQPGALRHHGEPGEQPGLPWLHRRDHAHSDSLRGQPVQPDAPRPDRVDIVERGCDVRSDEPPGTHPALRLPLQLLLHVRDGRASAGAVPRRDHVLHRP